MVRGEVPRKLQPHMGRHQPHELIDFQRQVPPGFYSYTWGKQEQRPTDPSDAKLDKFYDYDNKLVPAACAHSLH